MMKQLVLFLLLLFCTNGFSQNASYFVDNINGDDNNTLNLFNRIKSIDVPVHFIHGQQDGIAPYQTAVKYYEYLQAIKKTFTGFDNSAHMPHYDEPKKFAKVLRDTMNN